jgi:hypothetical protein
MDSMASSFCARLRSSEGDCIGGIRLLRAVAKGDRGDHVWLLRVLAQPGGMIDSMVSSFCAPIPTGDGALRRWLGRLARWARFS